MTTRRNQIHTIVVGDTGSSWTRAGFAVHDDMVSIGATTVHLAGGEQDGIIGVGIDGVDGAVDGLACDAALVRTDSEPHPNLVSAIDHLVAMSPSMARTTDALAAVGVAIRRQRSFSADGEARRQAFFWLGDVILELVGRDDHEGPGPARFWGLAMSCDDLDAAGALLGDHLGPPKPAVQEGRTIATLRTSELGISVPIALMTPHRRR